MLLFQLKTQVSFQYPEGHRLKKVKVTLEQAMKAQGGSRGIALLFL